MTLPALVVQQQGVGSVTADQENTKLQGAVVATSLRAFTGLTWMQVNVLGNSAADDGGAGVFYYDASSTAADDGVNVIAPNGQDQGRWLRVLLNSSGAIITGPQVDLASASTTDLGSASSHLIRITGTTAITSFGASASVSAPVYFLKFAGVLTLTNSAALAIPGGANITTAANDFAIVQYLGSGNWIVLDYVPANGGSAPFSIANDATTKAGVSTSLAVAPHGLAAVEQGDTMRWGGTDSSGTPNVITINLTPAITAYPAGMLVGFVLSNTVEAGGVNLNINSVGNKAIKISGQDPAANSMLVGTCQLVRYDGTNWELQGTWTSLFFESAEFAITTPSNGSASTGFGVSPRKIEGFLRCKSAELGYLVGDEVPLGLQHDTGGNHGIQAWVSGTTVKYQMGADNILVYNTSGAGTNITAASWKYFIRAWF